MLACFYWRAITGSCLSISGADLKESILGLFWTACSLLNAMCGGNDHVSHYVIALIAQIKQ